jgi:NitT/TauT family transport system substrate-binding protein
MKAAIGNRAAVVVCMAAIGASLGVRAAEPVRLGYFANLTHAQALVGVARGDFQKALGDVPLKTMVFNAGPSVVEAVMAGELDCSFIGPSPAINGYLKTKGAAFHVVCGVAANGVAIVARPGSGIRTLADLAGKRIATPQFGNTQDVSARVYVTDVLKSQLGEGKGQTRIMPIANAEQFEAMRRGDIDASWAPEPWASRMIVEGGATVVAEEKDLWPGKLFSTTVFVMSRTFMQKRPAQARALVRAVIEITDWMNGSPAEARRVINEQLKVVTGKALSAQVLDSACARVVFSVNPLDATLSEYAQRAYRVGMSKEPPDISGMLDTALLASARTMPGAR